MIILCFVVIAQCSFLLSFHRIVLDAHPRDRPVVSRNVICMGAEWLALASVSISVTSPFLIVIFLSNSLSLSLHLSCVTFCTGREYRNSYAERSYIHFILSISIQFIRSFPYKIKSHEIFRDRRFDSLFLSLSLCVACLVAVAGSRHLFDNANARSALTHTHTREPLTEWENI